jgi:ribosome-binding factor A
MTQRLKKVASQIQQIVAAELREQLNLPEASITHVDVSPDLRQATIWVGIVQTDRNDPQQVFEQIAAIRPDLQTAVAHQMTTKFVPRLQLERDSSGEYAQHINSLLRDL